MLFEAEQKTTSDNNNAVCRIEETAAKPNIKKGSIPELYVE
jgi:hypothetical protein